MANEHGLTWWSWIGVTDKTTEGEFTYNSNSQAIDFNPDWFSGFGSQGQGQNCIEVHVTNEWADVTCLDTRPSICWSIS